MKLITGIIVLGICGLACVGAWQCGGCAARVGGASLGMIAQACSWEDTSANSFRDVQTSSPHVMGSKLDVRSGNGSITLTQVIEGAGDVSIKARIKATTQERADAVVISTGRNPDQTLVIDAQWPGGKPLSNEGVSFDISLPDSGDQFLRSGNGAISVTGFECVIDASSGNGKMLVTNHAGNAKLHSGNGKIIVQGLKGSLDAGTGNGEIDAQEVLGAVTAKSGNGDVEIVLADESTGPVTMTTGNGGVILNVGEAFGGTIRASSGSGRLRMELPGAIVPAGTSNTQHKGEWMIPAGTGTGTGAGDNGVSTIKTGNGTVRVRTKKSPA